MNSQRTSYDPYASCVASFDHICILGLVSALGREDVRDGLIISPPLRALDVLLRGAHYRIVNTRRASTPVGFRCSP
jgi:hypothetical protein